MWEENHDGGKKTSSGRPLFQLRY
uniref:Uncharacterized protein n=1 Tax=Anguilla anguilla TaxID=7936 RepID=A0A0E9UNJ8_ANGAN